MNPGRVLAGLVRLVPAGWTITLSGVPISGGFSDKTTPAPGASEGDPGLSGRGTALFGSVEVKQRP